MTKLRIPPSVIDIDKYVRIRNTKLFNKLLDKIKRNNG